MRQPAHVDRDAARDVAAAYLDANSCREALTVAAFAQLTAETDELFRRMTHEDRPRALRVGFTTCETPYRDALELITSVAAHRTPILHRKTPPARWI